MNYSHNKAKDINNINSLPKKVYQRIITTRNLNFLNKYTDYFIKKYLEILEKSNLDEYNYSHIN